jgi:CheY-like chemotaxis protein
VVVDRSGCAEVMKGKQMAKSKSKSPSNESPKPKLLFLDDEPEWQGDYLEDLDDLFEVIPFHEAERALKYFDEYADVEAIVLDIMMPTPIGVSSAATNEGLDTGIWFLEQISDYIRAQRCPVILLTNRDKESYSDRLKQIGLPRELCEVRLKKQTSSEQLPILARQMINAAI